MANKVYIAPESSVTFTDSAGDVVITLQNLAAGAGRISVRHDKGANSQAIDFAWRATMQFETAPVVGETVDLYLSTSDGTNPDGEEGAADAALSDPDKLLNMLYIGSVKVTSVGDATDMTASGIITIAPRYFSVVVHNNTADNLKNTAEVNDVIVTPIPAEIQ